MPPGNAGRGACRRPAPTRVEHIRAVGGTGPKAFRGAVIGELQAREGRIESLEEHAGRRVVKAQAPLARMFGYLTQLRSMSEGRGTFSMQFLRYDVAGS